MILRGEKSLTEDHLFCLRSALLSLHGGGSSHAGSNRWHDKCIQVDCFPFKFVAILKSPPAVCGRVRGVRHDL